MITKTKISKGFVGNKNGYNFSIYFNEKTSPDIISALYKTKRETAKRLDKYLETGELETYGDAEK